MFMKMWSPLNRSPDPLTCFGERQPVGTYLLHLQVSDDLRICYGRFQQGRPLFTPAGPYLYVGSALSQRGATSLARRLLRHATRANGPPHPIRPHLQAIFNCQPPAAKRLHWHIDFLLEQTAVSLRHATLLFSATPQETAVARWLQQHPATAPLAPGLGASDHPRQSHLLAIGEDPLFRTELERFLTSLLP